MTDIKAVVKEKYSQIALGVIENGTCCGVEIGEELINISEGYEGVKGYVAGADLGLGCGLPTELAQINEGNTVVDLGSGAGNDAFIARSIVGSAGKVIGIDMTEPMIEKAKANAIKLGYDNVEFILGDIESIPLPDSIADVVVSNCVMNLVPDKLLAYKETFRIIKSGGHFSISDVVTIGDMPAELRKVADLYSGCVSGAVDETQYLDAIAQAGFTDIQIQKKRKVLLPDALLAQYGFDSNSVPGVYSVTIFGRKA